MTNRLILLPNVFWKNTAKHLRNLLSNSAWPHFWPFTASDYVETVLVRAPESIKFGLKSIKNHSKALILQGFYGLGRRCRRFESCHSDQNRGFDRTKSRKVGLLCGIFITSRKDYIMIILRLGKAKSILDGSINSALTAVETYNRPRTMFRIENYIVLMIIAWTKLFHAFFQSEIGEKYFYKEKKWTL